MSTTAQIRSELIAVRAQRDRFTAEALEALAPEVVEICRRMEPQWQESVDRPGARALRYLRGLLDLLRFHENEEQSKRRRDAFEQVCFDMSRAPLVEVRARVAGELGLSKLSIRRHEDAVIQAIAERLDALGGGARHQLVIVTGQHGVGRDHAAWQLARHLVPASGPAEVIAIEEELIETAAEQQLLDKHARDSWLKLFDLDQRTFRRLWTTTLRERVGPRLANAIDQGNVVLSLAAVRYHIPSTSIFSTADPMGFRHLIDRSDPATQHKLDVAFDRAIVLTLVDDIYDVFARLAVPPSWTGNLPLLHPDQSMFGGARRRPRRSVLLGLLLEWRTAEVSAAELIARSLRAEHVIMPAKYDVAALAGVVHGLPRCYLSHSMVTASRQRDRAAHAVVEQVKRVAHELRSKELVVFDSAAIDENRFITTEATPDEPRVAVAVANRLRDRWTPEPTVGSEHQPDDQPEDQPDDQHVDPRDRSLDTSLWEPMTEEQQRVAAQPFDIHRDIWGDDSWPPETCETLENLHSLVRNQVVWINRRLINQSGDALFFLRPYFGDSGRLSHVTKRELELAESLRALTPNRAEGTGPQRPRWEVLYHPRGDEVVRRNAAIVRQFCQSETSRFRVHWTDPAHASDDDCGEALLDLYQATRLKAPGSSEVLAAANIDTRRIRTLEQLARHYEGVEAGPNGHITIGAAFAETLTDEPRLCLDLDGKGISPRSMERDDLVELGELLLRCESGQPRAGEAATRYDRPEVFYREWTDRDWSSGGTTAVVDDLLQKARLASRLPGAASV